MNGTSRVKYALKQITYISRAKTIVAAEEQLLKVMVPFGLSYYVAWVAADPECVDPRANAICNWPEPWLQRYIDEKRFLFDPIVARAIATPGHFFWHEQGEPTTPEAFALMLDAQRYGMIDGFTLSWRSFWPLTSIVSLAGGPLVWSDIERQVMAAVTDAFLSRATYLRSLTRRTEVQALSPQEKRIVHLAAVGKNDKKIAAELRISPSTLKTHWGRIRPKLKAASRAQAVAMSVSAGQIGY